MCLIFITCAINLNHSMGKYRRRKIDDFPLKIEFDISCKFFLVLSPLETIYMKCQNMYAGKNRKNSSVCRLIQSAKLKLSQYSHVLFINFLFAMDLRSYTNLSDMPEQTV